MAAQVHAGLWRRNGYAVMHQVPHEIHSGRYLFSVSIVLPFTYLLNF